MDSGAICFEDSNSKSTCLVSCGDGVYEPDKGEACDDGNTIAGDGCSSSCTVEDGFSCENTIGFRSGCSAAGTVVCLDPNIPLARSLPIQLTLSFRGTEFNGVVTFEGLVEKVVVIENGEGSIQEPAFENLITAVRNSRASYYERIVKIVVNKCTGV